MAPQLMATKGAPLRAERAWIARATSSLPVPLSPVMSTVVLKSAILEMVRKMSSISRALGEDRLELVLLLDLLLERAVLAAQRLALLGLAQREDDLVRLERLAHVVVGARLHRLDGEVDVAVGAHHDDRRRVLLGLERAEQIEPAHARHAHVGEDDVGVERVERARAPPRRRRPPRPRSRASSAGCAGRGGCSLRRRRPGRGAWV